MKKLLILVGLVGALVLVMSAVAYAGGWWVEYGVPHLCEYYATRTPPTTTGRACGCPDGSLICDGLPGGGNCGTNGCAVVAANSGREAAPKDFPQLTSPPWGNPNTDEGEGTGNPHGGFSTSSNLCKTCHAVHLANPNSYRLLQDISRMAECDACHDATTGRSSHRPYGEMALAGLTVRGEHTLKTSTLIPDSNVNKCATTLGSCPGGAGCIPNCPTGGCTSAGKCDTPADKGRYPNRSVGDRTESGNGLYCFDCHSVHGANQTGWHLTLKDPAKNGGDATVGIDTNGDGDYNDPGEGTMADWESKVPGAEAFNLRTAFCADCHNLNSNYDGSADNADARGGNARSHVFGPAAGGNMEIYHDRMTESWPSHVGKYKGEFLNVQKHGCRACHSPDKPSEWPHQTVGHKILNNIYTDAPTWGGPDGWGGIDSGDPQRPLPAMDKICVDCHTSNGDGTGDGVGNTY